MLLNKIGFKTVYVGKEETILDRIVGEESDHWIKKKKFVVFALRLIFFIAKLTGKQNKLLILSRK